jgi:catechol 2,3-dioxygenase-like lactoylglutathione lyase family enzyme
VPIATVPDHVAVAVPSIDAAADRWRDQLGGGWASPRFAAEEAGFASRQLRYRGGAKLELLEPLDDTGFAHRFVTRYGARVHHVTLKVDALLPAVAALREDGFDVVDVGTDGDAWHEAFLRPSQVGGLIVQVAWSAHTDAEWLEHAGAVAEPPSDDGAVLLGPTLRHPDLTAAGRVWSLLGAEVTRDGDDVLAVTWPGSPLDLRVERGPTAAADGLRFRKTAALSDDPTRFGPAVRVVR